MKAATSNCERPRSNRRGQAIVESLVTLLVLLAAFLFFFDFAYSAVTRLFLCNGVARAARGAAVGFNSFHCLKAFRVGVIPVSGKRVVPEDDRVHLGAEGDLALVRTYLQSQGQAEAEGILHYERWDKSEVKIARKNKFVSVEGKIEIPDLLPGKFAALFGVGKPGEPQSVSSTWSLEDHASLYLTRSGE